MSTIELVNRREIDGNAVVHAKSRNWFSRTVFSELYKVVHSLLTTGSRLIKDVSTVISLSGFIVFGGYIDDKSYIVRLTTNELSDVHSNLGQGERALQLIAGLPEGSGLRKILTGHLVKQLWSELEHPPKSYLGDEYKYRTADGHNNVKWT